MAKTTPIAAPTIKAIALAALTITLLLIPVRAHTAPLLRQGDCGDSVALLQQLLLNAGFDPGPVDGIFGPRTLAATKEFQRSAGLVVDGVVGPQTWGALERLGDASRGAGRLKGRLIVIDPGHGGEEPGAISKWGDKEKHFTLGIASKVRRYLEEQGAVVIMTRYGDYSPGSDWSPRTDDLLARVSIANSRGADLFLSIHINAYPQDPGVSGVMGFYRANSSESRRLAKTLALSVADATGLRYIDTQAGPYYVLNHTYMPAALIEIGFMTNYRDVTLLRQDWFQNAVALGLARGVAEFLSR